MATGDPVDEDFELPGEQDADEGPGRGPWVLAGAAVVVALLALVGVVGMIEAMVAGGTRVQPAAAPPATTTTVPPVTAPATTVDPIPTVASPTPSGPPPTLAAPSIPVRSAPAVAPRPTRTTPPPATTRAPVPKPPGQLVRVPDVVGKRVKGAVATLEGAGFRVSVLGGAFVRPAERDRRRVTAQLPGGGSLALRGSRVVLITDGL